MLDLEALSDDIYDILAPLIAPSELTRENDDGARPTGTYSTFKIVTLDQVGYTDVGELDVSNPNAALVDVTAHYTLTLRVSSHGDNSKNQNQDLSFRIQNDLNVIFQFQALGLEQFNTPVVTDLPVFRDSKWEERSQSTFSFHFAHKETLSSEWIEQAGYLGEYFKQGNPTPVVIDDKTFP